MKSLAFTAFAAGLTLSALLYNLIGARYGVAAFNALGFVWCTAICVLRFRQPSPRDIHHAYGFKLAAIVMNAFADAMKDRSTTPAEARGALRGAAVAARQAADLFERTAQTTFDKVTS